METNQHAVDMRQAAVILLEEAADAACDFDAVNAVCRYQAAVLGHHYHQPAPPPEPPETTPAPTE